MIVPTSWHTIDMNPARRGRSIERMARSALGRSDQLASLRRSAVLAYREAMAGVAKMGGFLAATYYETAGKKPLSASALAFLGKAPLAEDGEKLGVPGMSAVLAGPCPDEVLTEGPKEVPLRVGPAVRTRARVTGHLDGSRPVTVDLVRYFVPIPACDDMLVMAFSTPTLYASDAFAVLFDQMAASAQWRLP